MTDREHITLPREVVEQLLKMLEMVEPYADQLTDYSSTAAEWPLNLLPEKVGVAITALRTALAAEQPKPSDDVEALRRDAYQGGWLREWLDSNGLLARAIRGESLAGYEHPDIKALRRDAQRYRWLKAKVEDYDGHACFPQVPYPAPIPDRSPFDAVDAAIDAAMQEDKT
jgi:hypothetical protein